MADEDELLEEAAQVVEGEESVTTWDIQSDCIASLAYDKTKGVAIFTFHKGGGKEYTAPISIQQATAWAHSSSPGEYFNEKIKDVYLRKNPYK